jgi:two-component system, NarL family, invasion response regulator UvrY
MRILLVEDHPIVRAGCRSLLEGAPGTEVREATTAADGLQLAREFIPEIVVLDLRLPDGNGLDLLEPLKLLERAPKVIIFSMYEDPAFAARALEAGARGYITKNDDPDLLLEAIRRVDSGGIFLTASMAEKLALRTTKVATDPLGDLSSRERDVLDLLGQGRTLAEIADQLNVSYRTSASIAAQIKSKLDISSTAALIKWAVDHRKVMNRV